MTFLADLLDDDGPIDLEVDAATAAELHRILGEAIGHNCAQTVLGQVREERARRGVPAVDDGLGLPVRQLSNLGKGRGWKDQPANAVTPSQGRD